jgi:phage terminase small subunit
MALSEREQRFVRALTGEALGNLTKAAELAGYSPKSAARQGYRLSKRAHVQTAIEARQQKLEAKADVSVERVLNELRAIAFSDVRGLFDEHGRLRPVHELSDDAAKALASVEVLKERTVKGAESTTHESVHKVKNWDKVKALEMLGRYLTMWQDKGASDSRVTVNIGFLAKDGSTIEVMPHQPQVALIPARDVG